MKARCKVCGKELDAKDQWINDSGIIYVFQIKECWCKECWEKVTGIRVRRW
jgi:hypothetical protein